MDGLTGDNATAGRDEITARLEALIGQPHVSEEYIRFRMDLLQAQWAVRQALAGISRPCLPSGWRDSSGAASALSARIAARRC